MSPVCWIFAAATHMQGYVLYNIPKATKSTYLHSVYIEFDIAGITTVHAAFNAHPENRHIDSASEKG